MPLTSALNIQPTGETRGDIVKSLWPRQPTTESELVDLDWDPYFLYYAQECAQALQERGRFVSVRQHGDVITIVQRIEELQNKEEIIKASRPRMTKQRSPEETDRMVDGSVNLAARLLGMMDVGALPNAYSGRKPLQWSTGSLKECVKSYFDVAPRCHHDGMKLDKSFTAYNLRRISGLEVVWTNNLCDHLRLMNDDTRVCVFYHASFLKWQDRYLPTPFCLV
jgi:hypothetical protein